MQKFMNFFDSSKKLNQTPHQIKLPYHPQKKQYQIIHQALMIPNLPAPLHYFNFLSIIGQPNAPMLLNKSAILNNNPQNTATLLCSISAHMHGYFHAYEIEKQCKLNEDFYQFDQREYLMGQFPQFTFVREDTELSANITITTTNLISHFTKLKLPLFDHWSLLCKCEGDIKYNNQNYQINTLGSFEYARAVNFPYIPLCFFTYQIINLNSSKQMLMAQIRNNFNQIVQSRIYIRNLELQQSEMFEKNVKFINHRIYPAITTPNGHTMYLPREFEWQYEDHNNKIRVFAQSRGDFKFGLAAGYVGSFHYHVQINDEEYSGESGYCEYIDCRPLKWQEKNKEEKLLDDLANTIPILLKK